MKLTKNDLQVLGYLMDRPMHGYEIGQAIKAEGGELWSAISTAAIYYSLGKLDRLGLIVEAHSRVTSGDRTVYHITESGREQFLSGIQSLLDSRDPIRTEYDLGISMLNRLSRVQAEPLVRRRISFLRDWVAQLEQPRSGISPLQDTMMQHAVASGRLDIQWLTGIADRLGAGEGEEPYARGLMALGGDLQEAHLPDLVKRIAMGKHSGTLVLSAGEASRTVTFDQGRPHCASSQVAGNAELDRQRVLDDLYELFRWQRGTYVFDQRRCPREGCMMLDFSADLLILEGARRLDAWEIIQRIVTGSDAVFERRDAGGRLETPALTEGEDRVLALVDGSRDVTALASLCGSTEFETSRILYGLDIVDLVQPADPNRSRLRRVFRESAELMCRGAMLHRADPAEAEACEDEVNRRCQGLPVSIRDSHIVDHTSPNLTSDELAEIYRRFLQTQLAVLGERVGQNVVDGLRREVLNKLNPSLRETLEAYALL